MKRRPKTIKQKLRGLFYLITIFLAVTMLVITMASYLFQLRENVKDESLSVNQKNTGIITSNIDMLYSSFLFEFGTENFLSELRKMTDGTSSVGQSRYDFQNELLAFRQQNSLLVSAVLLDAENDICYSLYEERVDIPAQQILSAADRNEISGITWLPGRKTPFAYQEEVLYLVIPLKIDAYLQFSGDRSETDAYLIGFVSEERLAQLVTASSENAKDHTFFLFTDSGTLLNGFGPASEDRQVQDLVRRNLASGLFEDPSSLIVSSMIPGRGLYVADYTDKMEKFLSLISYMAIIYLCLLATIGIVMAVSYLFLKRNITEPITRLLDGVELVKEGKYGHRIEIADDGDMGMLATRINEMSGRIAGQIEAIRKQEEQQYRTELKLLTEQLNPHFIYNTLEYVRQSLVSDAAEQSDIIIGHLSQYLRTALAQGRDLVPILNEMKHIVSYVKIMECRFAHPINLTVEGEKGIENCLVLKTLLQPIVENAIKHGFNIDSDIPTMHDPSLEIRFRREGDTLTITVNDNGFGFDPGRVGAIMRGEIEEGRHLGLANTYSRLQTFYGPGRAGITLSSIPFYRNSFVITVPFTGEGA